MSVPGGSSPSTLSMVTEASVSFWPKEFSADTTALLGGNGIATKQYTPALGCWMFALLRLLLETAGSIVPSGRTIAKASASLGPALCRPPPVVAASAAAPKPPTVNTIAAVTTDGRKTERPSTTSPSLGYVLRRYPSRIGPGRFVAFRNRRTD